MVPGFESTIFATKSRPITTRPGLQDLPLDVWLSNQVTNNLNITTEKIWNRIGNQ